MHDCQSWPRQMAGSRSCVKPSRDNLPRSRITVNPFSVIKREHILAAIGELDAGHVDHPYRTPTKYVMHYQGRTYAPKAVVGIASRIVNREYPKVLRGGESQSNQILRRLGFQVERIQRENAKVDSQTDWTEREVSLLVTDYFAMLASELAGKEFSKSKHRKALQALGLHRSDSSIEFKHSNLSAILVKMGLPYINGYKPRGNYQALLSQRVEEYLKERPETLDAMWNSPLVDPDQAPSIRPISDLLDTPPEQIIEPDAVPFDWHKRTAKRMDFVRRDAENRKLGTLGEQYVVEVERRRLLAVRRDDLSRKVSWIARDFGDGTGFDVLSFDERDDREKLIEVKTTGLPKDFPFYVTSVEVRCSEAHPDAYHLYRLFNFSTRPRLYVLRGALPGLCQLDPIAYRASPKV